MEFVDDAATRERPRFQPRFHPRFHPVAGVPVPDPVPGECLSVTLDVSSEEWHGVRVVREHDAFRAAGRSGEAEKARARAELEDSPPSDASRACLSAEVLRQAKGALPHDSATTVVQGLVLLDHQLHARGPVVRGGVGVRGVGCVAADAVSHHRRVGEVEETLRDARVVRVGAGVDHALIV